MTTINPIPVPEPIAQQHSDHLLSIIMQKISDAGGKITFTDYMQCCLYEPGLGYYSAGSYKLGVHGDFTTAPEISSLFSRTLANHISDVFAQIDKPNILEFGAGSGKMAIDILKELTEKNSLPDTYYIIEASADLQQRQQSAISHSLPHLKNKVVWLQSIPENFIGVIVANEVCDAMPVHCVKFHNDQFNERYIGQYNGELCWVEGELSCPELINYCANIAPLVEGYELTTEINLIAKAWISSLADKLKQGAIFVIDYGHAQTSYYHPQRENGTLMCYYQHQGHDNPLILMGLQDITAHVDFTSLAQTALDNDLDVAGFQSQTDFLLAGGITEFIPNNHQHDELAHLQFTIEIKQLTHPSAMGETFKVLTLSRQLDHLLNRAQLGDRRHNL